MRLGGVAGLGVAGAALIGCGDDEDPTATPTEAAGDATPSPTVAADNGSPSATPTEADAEPAFPDEFVVANAAEPADLGPWFGGFEQALVTRQIYQTLIEPRLTLAADGSPEWELVGVLAESWEREGDATWLIKLREGVTFHNGEAWNADAAVASYELLGNPEIVEELQKFALLGAILSMEKVDDMSVRVTTAAPGTEPLTLYLRLGFVGLPAAAIAGEGWRDLLENPVGTGPYQFKNWSRGDEIELELVSEHWADLGPMPQTVKFITRPEASVRALTIDTGEAHFAYNIGAENAAQLDHGVAAGG